MEFNRDWNHGSAKVVSAGAQIRIVPVEFSPPLDVVNRTKLNSVRAMRLHVSPELVGNWQAQPRLSSSNFGDRATSSPTKNTYIGCLSMSYLPFQAIVPGLH